MRKIFRLSPRKLPSLTAPGRYPDGHLLYLQVAKPGKPSEENGGRSWIIRYRAPGTGRVREMGLGPLLTVSLEEARARRDAACALLKSGADPLADRAMKRAVAAKDRTFGEFTTDYLTTALSGFKNAKHQYQWRQTLEQYAKPLWAKSLRIITTADVFDCLDPIWDTKPETARRLRGRIERVLGAAKAQGLREGENPASWENVKALFEGRKKAAPKHHPAIPYKEMPAFMRELWALKSTSALALEFLILTAARPGEVRGMRWREVNIADKKWTVPAERMKMKNEHTVPLTHRGVEILRSLKPGKPQDLVFPGAKPREPLSDTALLMCLRGIRPGFTSHGFRSTFSDWIGDETCFPRDLREFALAHKISNDVEAAYRRQTGFEKRRVMMAAWADYIAPKSRTQPRRESVTQEPTFVN